MVNKNCFRGAFGCKVAENVVVSFLECFRVPLEKSLGTPWLVVVVAGTVGSVVAGDPASSLAEGLACSALGGFLGHGREGPSPCP